MISNSFNFTAAVTIAAVVLVNASRRPRLERESCRRWNAEAKAAFGGIFMLHITRAIIVEGIYDRQRVGEVCDAFCLVTGGFDIFSDREKRDFIRRLAREKGIIVLTDPDRAGFAIRAHIKNIVREGEVLHAYIPEIYGKERRKARPSAEGKLGVEGMERQALEEALRPFAADSPAPVGEPVTKSDLFDLGLSGSPDSSARRRELCVRMGLPARISANSLLAAINAIMTKKQFGEIANSIKI